MQPQAEFEQFVKALRKQDSSSWTEETAKHAAIVPVLTMMGWSQFQMQFEVKIKARHNHGLVDIKLEGGRHSILIECKKPSVDLDQGVGQLFEYAYYDGSHLAVLTNGIRWDLYLAHGPEVPNRDRRFASIDLQSKAGATDLYDELARFLDQANVKSGKANRNAKERLKAKQRGDQVKDALPVAWRKILHTPTAPIIELIEKAVRSQIGHTPTEKQIRSFLLRRSQLELSGEQAEETLPEIRKRKAKREITGFILWEQYTKVESFAEMAALAAAAIHRRNPEAFERMQQRTSRIRSTEDLIAENAPMDRWKEIPGTRHQVFVGTGADRLEAQVRKMLQDTGGDPEEFRTVE